MSATLLDDSDGILETLLFDEGSDSFAIQRTSDVTALIDHNKALCTDGSNGYGESREWKRIASIPLGVIEGWKQHLGIDFWDKNHWPAVRRLLNSPDWAALRTAPGKL